MGDIMSDQIMTRDFSKIHKGDTVVFEWPDGEMIRGVYVADVGVDVALVQVHSIDLVIDKKIFQYGFIDAAPIPESDGYYKDEEGNLYSKNDGEFYWIKTGRMGKIIKVTDENYRPHKIYVPMMVTRTYDVLSFEKMKEYEDDCDDED